MEPMERACAGPTSVEALDSHRAQGAVIRKLDAELDRAAAHFAIFYVFALAGRQVDAGFEALTAIRTLHRHELLELPAAAGAAAHTRLEHGLESIQLVDVSLVAAGDAPCEGVELGGSAAGHGEAFYASGVARDRRGPPLLVRDFSGRG
jgi:hypothetical protein